MEFWGVEVKSGEPLVVKCSHEFIVHLSQACLGEVKKDKGNELVVLSVKIEDKKIVIGTLSAEKFPHLSLDLVFHKDFELSHNSKHGSVYFSGYKIFNQYSSDDESESEHELAKDLPVISINGKRMPDTEKQQPHTEKAKPDSAGSKQKVKIVEPKKDDSTDEETDDSDDGSDDEDDSSDGDSSNDDKDMMTAIGEDDEGADGSDESDDDSDESGESDDEDEEAPTMLKAEQGKKRSAVSVKKTPVPDKKTKLVTPQKTDGKKASVHVATPHPSKKILKTPASSSQKEQNQKSFSCKACNRSFGSENALQSHSKDKHGVA